MSRLMRQELDRQNRGGSFHQFFNRPLVLVPLFLLCIALLVWTFWFREDDEHPSQVVGNPDAQGMSEAERIYREGHRHQEEGDLGAAQRSWRQVIDLFQTVDAEREWVGKARQRLEELRQQDDNKRWASVRFALRNARQLKDEAAKLKGAEKQAKLAKARQI